MAIFFGIAIADPSKKNLDLTRKENEHYDVTRKLPGKPQGPFKSEQSKFRIFKRYMPDVTNIPTTNYSTVPVYPIQNLEMMQLWSIRRKNLRARVEIPQLEAAKYLHDTVDSRAFYDPKSVNSVSFKQTIKPKYKGDQVDPARRLSDEYGYAKQAQYLYVSDTNSFQKYYYKNNSWKDSHGRIHLFERPYTRIAI